MPQLLKKISPVIFGIALICFILPWVNFSCQGQRITTLTGLQLVTGTTIQQQGMFGGGKSQKVEPELLAIFVLICAGLGLALSFITKATLPFPGTSIVSMIGLILLMSLRVKIDADMANQGQGMIQVEYSAGYWLVFALFVGAIALNGFLYFSARKEVRTAPSQT